MKPKLRFKEFNSNWNTYKFYELVTIKNGQVNPNDEQYRNLPHIGPGNIEKETGRLLEYNLAKDDKLVSSKYLFDKESVIYGKINPHFAKVCYPKFVGLCSADAYPINPIKGKITSEFLLYLLLNPQFTKFATSVSMRTGMPKINRDELSIYKFTIPEIAEQNKIGNMLTLLDKKINLQSKKIEDLKLFKKGLINDELNNLNNCQSIPLNDLGTTYSGLSGKTKEDFENGNCKFINFMSVLKDNIDVSLLTTVKINPNEKQNKVEKGDLFFMTSSETKEDVALCSTLSYEAKDLYLNSFCFGYRINDLNIINNEYLNCLLHSPKYRKQISNLGQGFTRVNISKNKLLELFIEVPDIKQQLRIVSINNRLNCKIDLENNKLNKLNELKKGLMQNMFV